MSKNIPDDILSTRTGPIMLNSKKRKNDPSLSHRKRDQLKNLWLEWKYKPDTQANFENKFRASISLPLETTAAEAEPKLISVPEIEDI